MCMLSKLIMKTYKHLKLILIGCIVYIFNHIWGTETCKVILKREK